MKQEANPYVFCISDREMVDLGNIHHALSCKLTDGGFDVDMMLLTASPHSYTHAEQKKKWDEAMKQAKISRIEKAYDPAVGRTWFRVWRNES